MNSQDLILGRIINHFDKDDSYILLVDRSASNTGTLRCLDAENLRQIAALTYNFQDGYCMFDLPGSGQRHVASHWYGSDRLGNCHTIPDLIDAVITYLE